MSTCYPGNKVPVQHLMHLTIKLLCFVCYKLVTYRIFPVNSSLVWIYLTWGAGRLQHKANDFCFIRTQWAGLAAGCCHSPVEPETKAIQWRVEDVRWADTVKPPTPTPHASHTALHLIQCSGGSHSHLPQGTYSTLRGVGSLAFSL